MNKKVLLLSNNINAWELFSWLQEKENVLFYSGKLNLEILQDIKPQLVISYNYKYIISEDVIDFMKGEIINLHISLLPWNRGSSPNFWSFIENTPKGVTIHRVAKGLDTGEIVFQKELFFDESMETFKSTYDILQNEIVSLFKDNWDSIISGRYRSKPQTEKGSYHTSKMMEEYLQEKDFSWDMKICDFKRRYTNA